ncbi:MAG: hypothetical protein F6K42_22230, partial [Leptolyngbya sp. SIO1D8]|nr:hypothetical protein [Leptolyngbya sp. SIO1D8]
MKWLRRCLYPKKRLLVLGILSLLLVIGAIHLIPEPTTIVRVSSYQLSQQAPFNRSDYYAAVSYEPPTFTSNWYRPAGDWVGRLRLPTAAETERERRDWVWFIVQQAP